MKQLLTLPMQANEVLHGLNQSGTILLVNRPTEQLFGYSRQELAGQNINLPLPALTCQELEYAER